MPMSGRRNYNSITPDIDFNIFISLQLAQSLSAIIPYVSTRVRYERINIYFIFIFSYRRKSY